MKTSSCKAKGRRAAQETKEAMLRHCPELQDGDILVTSSGATGEDLMLSPKAREYFPVTIETKCQERLNLWDCIEQAEGHAANTPWQPILVFKRNRTKLRAVVDFDLLCRLLCENAQHAAPIPEPDRRLP